MLVDIMQSVNSRLHNWRDIHPQAKSFCSRAVVIALLVTSVIGLLCGVLAYHVASGQMSLHAFSSISFPTSCFMIGAFAVIFVISIINLGYISKKTANM